MDFSDFRIDKAQKILLDIGEHKIGMNIQNKQLLYTTFEFMPEALLKLYLQSVNKDYFTWAKILIKVKDTVTRESLFDEKNPSMILCARAI